VPGNKQGGGKRLSGKTRRGNALLEAAWSEAAWANVRSQASSIEAQVRRLTRRRGLYRALIAVAHSLLVSIYPMPTSTRPYQELGLATSTHWGKSN
jgi:transposase